MPGKHGPLAERHESKTDRSPGLGPDGSCHEWTAARKNKDYGVIGESGKMFLAHRVAWELVNGPIPEGLCVLHHCDNPPCVNVEHLFLGTLADNNADKVAKGRQAKGSAIARAKLTESDIPEIRRLLAVGVLQSEIGRRYGVGHRLISKINLGKRWGHVQ